MKKEVVKKYISYETASDSFRNNIDNIAQKINVLNADKKVVMFVGASAGAGNTVMAKAYAETEALTKKTLLIDFNLVSPELNAVFGMSGAGLAEVLEKKACVEEVVKSFGNLDVMILGDCTRKLLSQADKLFADFLNTVTKNYDRIVIDAASLEKSAIAMTLCPLADSIVLVIFAGCKKRFVVNAFQSLDIAKGKIVGAVLNRI